MNSINFNLEEIKKVHFIGIGGIGVSALARMMLLSGIEVSGSDMSLSEITDELRRRGAKIFEGHAAKNVPADVLVIHTLAIGEDNPELLEARVRNLPIMNY